MRPRRTLIDRLREDLLVAERLNLDYPDLYRALPASGAPITLGEIAQRLQIELRTPERNVLLYGLTRHLGIIRLRNDHSGCWMFARRPRLGPPRPLRPVPPPAVVPADAIPAASSISDASPAASPEVLAEAIPPLADPRAGGGTPPPSPG